MDMAQIKLLILQSGIYLSEQEIEDLEVTDFGLGDFNHIGLTVHTYLNTDRCCAKELMILPNQTCPEHRHPNNDIGLGKEETFRCRFGKVSIFIEGEVTANPQATPPKNGKEYYSVFHEVVLQQGEQLTLMPDTRHWFQAHDNGAVVSEFSTHSNDATDIFSDIRINRFSLV